MGGQTASMVFDGEDQDRHLQSMPFDAFSEITPQGVQGFQQKYGYLGLRFLPYNPTHYDVIPQRVGKSIGLAALLEKLGMDAAQVAAVGDAPEQVKALADAVCPHVDEDGVAALCRTLFPEAFPNG